LEGEEEKAAAPLFPPLPLPRITSEAELAEAEIITFKCYSFSECFFENV
jgi:hypothetical protein